MQSWRNVKRFESVKNIYWHAQARVLPKHDIFTSYLWLTFEMACGCCQEFTRPTRCLVFIQLKSSDTMGTLIQCDSSNQCHCYSRKYFLKLQKLWSWELPFYDFCFHYLLNKAHFHQTVEHSSRQCITN